MSLDLKGISTGYGTGPVLHDIHLTVKPGEIVTLIGANGAGKTTLAKTPPPNACAVASPMCRKGGNCSPA